ncbi:MULTISPECIES: TIGR03621 family F420-dependent LLM class oxidoreductase [unclassified Mycobacterium]|uniref:TIGR03621 family F420-dependent LLM class oxidoreductase n=1 Tax=unclassified Mycobacterium TaxID=2642494 RepID=UPI002570780D|nr:MULTISPECIES: TIGR03621 family F420-dependent LLM class oxidoreductase [unclassified Mycobacterium]
MIRHGFRFGTNLISHGDIGQIRDQVRQAEDCGVDVIVVPDHLGVGAPFPVMLAAASVSTTVRVGSFVLTTGFYSSRLLARDIATADRLTDGRVEIGLGAGYVQQEYEAAGVPFLSPAARVQQLADAVGALRGLLSSPHHWPRPVQSPVPIMIAGKGDKILKLAAQQADIIAISDAKTRADLAERAAYVLAAAGHRADSPELNLGIFDVAIDRSPDLGLMRVYRPHDSDDELLASPTLLHGSKGELIEQILALREELGISYLTYMGVDPRGLKDFHSLIAALT